jgi:hypothetical protein
MSRLRTRWVRRMRRGSRAQRLDSAYCFQQADGFSTGLSLPCLRSPKEPGNSQRHHGPPSSTSAASNSYNIRAPKPDKYHGRPPSPRLARTPGKLTQDILSSLIHSTVTGATIAKVRRRREPYPTQARETRDSSHGGSPGSTRTVDRSKASEAGGPYDHPTKDIALLPAAAHKPPNSRTGWGEDQ